MAAGLALAKAKITAPDGVERVGSVLVRGNRLQVRVKTELVLEDPSVHTVERLDSRTWRVWTDAGTFSVVRERNCGCGRG
jgi:hypothetical protein